MTSATSGSVASLSLRMIHVLLSRYKRTKHRMSVAMHTMILASALLERRESRIGRGRDDTRSIAVKGGSLLIFRSSSSLLVAMKLSPFAIHPATAGLQCKEHLGTIPTRKPFELSVMPANKKYQVCKSKGSLVEGERRFDIVVRQRAAGVSPSPARYYRPRAWAR